MMRTRSNLAPSMSNHEAIDRPSSNLVTDLGLDRLPNLSDIQDASDLRTFDEVGQNPLLDFITEVTTAVSATTWAI